ncbi:hypothetical protein SPI_01434 [Niveomyces insectorum RCEF 264]|uniref:Uncharacterized protein n=1 Tax=Niveomyces insectorum RCEF 264 TaxID=1081102 RepID=A0A167YYT8_9HYPO|nr:hypothetical protein SPI_01434 [Niveomyces insectorum RCEF 264]
MLVSSPRDTISGPNGSSVKAMAAMFDSVALNPQAETPPSVQSQTIRPCVLECQSWKERAEAAEKRVDELELIIAANGGIRREDDIFGGGANPQSIAVTLPNQSNKRQSWKQHTPHPSTTPAHISPGVKEQLARFDRQAGDMSPSANRAPLLGRRGVDSVDNITSENSSTTTVVAHGRLGTERMLPFV